MPSRWRLLKTWPLRAWRQFTGGSWTLALTRLLVAGVLAAGLGGVFVASGLVSIAADTGHWAITRWFLGVVMTHTVNMRSLGTQVPPLDDPALVLKGAGHYASGCATCHGAPGQPRAMVVEQMVPSPPTLSHTLDRWEPAQLHWIVKHGLKYTAMPAWPSQQRDDEVWAMVAFLQRLPGMDAARYRALAYGSVATNQASTEGAQLSTLLARPLSTLDNCARCHGADGEGRGNGAIPRLAGQRESYLLASLQAYARGTRHSGIMQPVAAGLDAAQMPALARHYASLSLPSDVAATASAANLTSAPASSPADARARGAALAARGIGNQRIPACRYCHGPGATQRNPIYPRLAGQHPRYLALQLRLFQQGRRGGTRYQHLMHRAASALSEQQIEDLAVYYGSLDVHAPVPAAVAGKPAGERQTAARIQGMRPDIGALDR